MKDMLSLIEKAVSQGHEPEAIDIHEYCRSTRLSLREFCNRYALSLAQGFAADKLSYEFCDDAMNYLFNFIMEPQFLEAEDGMPQPAFTIFQAFDAAEYFRGGGTPGDDPVEQHTRPRIAEILRQQPAAPAG